MVFGLDVGLDMDVNDRCSTSYTNEAVKGNSSQSVDKKEEKREVVLSKTSVQKEQDPDFLVTLVFLEPSHTIVHRSAPEPGSADFFFHQERGTLNSEWKRHLDERPSGRRPNYWKNNC